LRRLFDYVQRRRARSKRSFRWSTHRIARGAGDERTTKMRQAECEAGFACKDQQATAERRTTRGSFKSMKKSTVPSI